jgi:hypothetical protein
MDLGEILCSRVFAARAGAVARMIAIQMYDECTGIVRQKCEYCAGPGGKNLVMDHLMIVPVTRHDHLHQIFQTQLHFLQADFQFHVFDVPVGLTDEFLELGFTAGVFFEEPAVFLVRFQQGLPDIMRRDRHPFPPGVQKRSHKRNNYHNWAVEAKRQEVPARNHSSRAISVCGPEHRGASRSRLHDSQIFVACVV